MKCNVLHYLSMLCFWESLLLSIPLIELLYLRNDNSLSQVLQAVWSPEIAGRRDCKHRGRDFLRGCFGMCSHFVTSSYRVRQVDPIATHPSWYRICEWKLYADVDVFLPGSSSLIAQAVWLNTPMMSHPETENKLFLASLFDGEKLEELKKLNLKHFDWTMCFEGKTLMVSYIEEAMQNVIPKEEDLLRIIEWLVSCGASITQECTSGSTSLSFEDDATKKRVDKVEVKCRGLSAIDYVTTWRKETAGKPRWLGTWNFLGKVRTCFLRAIERANQPRVSVHQGVADLWEKFLLAKASHDLKIVTSDGIVTAHAQMLKEGSSVLRAMLESPMKEGQTQCIEVKDASSSGVSLFLEILYTCSTQSDSDFQTVLHALDLAHRWQVEFVVAILAELLQTMITDESFSAIAEHAILKGLDDLKTPLQMFGMTSRAVQAQLKDGHLSSTVMQLFPGDKKSMSEAPKPKRRRL